MKTYKNWRIQEKQKLQKIIRDLVIIKRNLPQNLYPEQDDSLSWAIDYLQEELFKFSQDQKR
ncbi:MAG: hypothetical protein COV00_03490 [Candidatus Tagabacteria bacterium CG10_big_fil_rev_8_21_14_0_10_40_13]|uniref:Uncharacterized protein n=1 Tax=Candidatus Tagabacteria bacterium CG10_big_fil_rev_8_21_14_0_10_40_13 TaxID=1975022 RepID=A0A2M8L862_9BACT|nr:MAG: hypothetical protein COV00_03490 [Candidatus Tagabacteria bacterium CG10_big_fil_rev_8_21_14_0_10_40_13]